MKSWRERQNWLGSSPTLSWPGAKNQTSTCRPTQRPRMTGWWRRQVFTATILQRLSIRCQLCKQEWCPSLREAPHLGEMTLNYSTITHLPCHAAFTFNRKVGYPLLTRLLAFFATGGDSPSNVGRDFSPWSGSSDFFSLWQLMQLSQTLLVF